MEYRFNSIAEVMEFVGCLTAKAKKSGKGEADGGEEQAGGTGSSPQPMAPPTGQAGFPGGQQGFTAPPAGGAAPQMGAGAFPALGAPTAPAIDPAIAAWVQKIGGVIDATMPTPKGAEMLTWFRNNFGPEAAQATADQIKTVFLPRLNVEQLAGMGKMMGLT